MAHLRIFKEPESEKRYCIRAIPDSAFSKSLCGAKPGDVDWMFHGLRHLIIETKQGTPHLPCESCVDLALCDHCPESEQSR